MFKTAIISTARVIVVILTAGAAQSATTPADLPQLDAATPQSFEAAREPAVEFASYCNWVVTYEEGTTERPTWCDADQSNDS